MTATIFFASAAAAGLAVLLLTWKKAGIGRTMLAAAIGMAVGVGAAMAVAAQMSGQDMAFAPSELLSSFVGVFLAATASNRRYHARQLQQEKQKA